MRVIGFLAVIALCLATAGCRTKEEPSGPPVPASSDPTGKDLVAGGVVIATEDSGGVRIYKIKQVNYFPPPVGDELVMVAFKEKGKDFAEAAELWSKRQLTVALANVRVARHMFVKHRKYRVIAKEPVTPQELALEREDKLPPLTANQ